MEIADYDLGTARVQDADWLGTVAAEDDSTASAETLYEVVGLDPDRWSILAIDFNGGTASRGENSITVYAIDIEKTGLVSHTHADLIALAEERGHIPVTNFEVHGVEAERVIERTFKRYHVRLASPWLQGTALHVEARDDLGDASH